MMIRRREFIAGLACVPSGVFSVRAQERVLRLGVLIFSAENDPVSGARLAALRGGLADAGWAEGRNLEIAVRFGGADPGRLRASAEELVSSAPDVIVTGAAPATLAVQQLTQTIPIVFVETTNEVGYRTTGDHARQGQNATGITNLYLAIANRWVELLKEAAPHMTRVALLFNPEFDSRSYVAAIEASAASYHVKGIKIAARNGDDIERGIRGFAAEPNGGLLVVPPTPNYTEVQLLFRLATKYRLPAIYPTRGLAAEGGLMAFAPVSEDLFRSAATYVDRILHGAKPSDLPIQFPTKFDLVINQKTARAIGLQMPHGLLGRAAEIIE
jgi:putative ABC transport system substrate-binding protein